MKGLQDIKAENEAIPASPTPNRLRDAQDDALRALNVAEASLVDARKFGTLPERQATNIKNVDLPIIRRAKDKLARAIKEARS